MSEIREWWLIRNADANEIQAALTAAIARVEARCAETGCMCDLNGTDCAKLYRDALHTLDSGLHVTDAVPSDYAAAATGPEGGGE